VIESFDKLLEVCYQDFGPVYERIGTAADIEPFELVEADDVLARGTLAYFQEKPSVRSLSERSSIYDPSMDH